MEDGQVKGYIVEKGTPGLATTKMKDKMALRVVQNASITLDDVRVPEANRLAEGGLVPADRAGAAGHPGRCRLDGHRLRPGRIELALAYAGQREQFGKPIAGFQLIQDLLVRMLANVTASACLCARLAQLQAAGTAGDEHSALAKAFCTVRMRETVGYARELLGGNGILLEHQVGQTVATPRPCPSCRGWPGDRPAGRRPPHPRPPRLRLSQASCPGRWPRRYVAVGGWPADTRTCRSAPARRAGGARPVPSPVPG